MQASVGSKWKAVASRHQTGCLTCKSSRQAAFDERGWPPPRNSVECDPYNTGFSAFLAMRHWFSLIGKILPFITSTYTINTLKSVPINPREALIGLMLYDPTYPNFPRNPCD